MKRLIVAAVLIAVSIAFPQAGSASVIAFLAIDHQLGEHHE